MTRTVSVLSLSLLGCLWVAGALGQTTTKANDVSPIVTAPRTWAPVSMTSGTDATTYGQETVTPNPSNSSITLPWTTSATEQSMPLRRAMARVLSEPCARAAATPCGRATTARQVPASGGHGT